MTVIEFQADGVLFDMARPVFLSFIPRVVAIALTDHDFLSSSSTFTALSRTELSPTLSPPSKLLGVKLLESWDYPRKKSCSFSSSFDLWPFTTDFALPFFHL